MSNISDKLGIGNEVREFKLGRSFAGNSASAFHSIRYDFKPASVDTSKMATLAIGERQQVTVHVPHVEGNAQAVFMGSKKQYQKECVLIIDHNTGEITLEKLSSNMQLKKTRSEGSSRAHQGRPITPIDNLTLPPPPPSHSSLHQKKPSPSQSRYSPSSNFSKTSLPSPNQQRSSPWTSTSPHESPNTLPVASHSGHSNASSNPSMPNFLVSATTLSPPLPPAPIPPPPPSPNTISRHPVGQSSRPTQSSLISPSMPQFLGSAETQSVPEVGVLSESSSDSSSSSSGEDDDEPVAMDDNQRSHEIGHSKIEPQLKKKRRSSASSSSGASFVSESEDPDEHLRTDHRNKPQPPPANPGSQPHGGGLNLLPSMPKFSQLSEDLQLSESGSDSDD